MIPAADPAPCSTIVPPENILVPSSKVRFAAVCVPLTAIEFCPVASPPDAPVPAANTAVSPLIHAPGVVVPVVDVLQKLSTPQVPLAGDDAGVTAPVPPPFTSQQSA